MLGILSMKNAQCYHFYFICGIYLPFYYEMFHFSACDCPMICVISHLIGRVRFTFRFSLVEFFYCSAEEHFEMLEKHMKQPIWYTRCCCTWSKDRWWKPKHHHIKSNLFVTVACEHNMSALFDVVQCCCKRREKKNHTKKSIKKLYMQLKISCCVLSQTFACDLGLICTLTHKRWMVSISMFSSHIA